jgi:hypothetical protein
MTSPFVLAQLAEGVAKNAQDINSKMLHLAASAIDSAFQK